MLQMKYSSINRIAGVERASLEEVDRPSPYSAILNFRSILLHDMLSNGNLFRDFFFLFCRFVRFLTSQANRSG